MGHQRTRYSAATGNRRGVLGFWAAPVLVAMSWWVWSRVGRLEVSGLSMAPLLQPGDRLVIWRTAAVRAGDVVAAPDPRALERTVLKRACAVGPSGVLLLGDNYDQSTDSRDFGRIPVASVRGRVVYRYAPAGRAGRLPRT